METKCHSYVFLHFLSLSPRQIYASVIVHTVFPVHLFPLIHRPEGQSGRCQRYSRKYSGRLCFGMNVTQFEKNHMHYS